MADLRLLGIKNRWTQEKKITGPNVEWLIKEVERLQILVDMAPKSSGRDALGDILRRHL